MKKRCSAAAALALALFFLSLAGSLAFFRPSAAAAGLSGQVQAASPALSAGEAALPQGQDGTWVIRSVDGEVCIFQGETLLLHTGVSADLLPRQDREALEAGIQVESREALTALLEDLGS